MGMEFKKSRPEPNPSCGSHERKTEKQGSPVQNSGRRLIYNREMGLIRTRKPT